MLIEACPRAGKTRFALEHTARLRNGASVPEDLRRYRLGPEDLILIDEAGMAGTLMLDNAATLRLRTGETAAIDWHHHHGRIQAGSREAMVKECSRSRQHTG